MTARVRRRTARLAVALVAICAGGPAATGHAGTERAALGVVGASLEYPEDPVGADPVLTITRDGRPLFAGRVGFAACGDDPCLPGGALETSGDSIFVRQLDATPEPEVVLRMYTRGAHCCVIGQVWQLGPDAASPARDLNFGNGDFTLRDADGDGREEFWTQDDRFAYRFASYASSGRPLRVLAYEQGALRDITARYRAEVAADAARWWRVYRTADRDKRERLGLLAAWAADQYLLGRRGHAARVIRRERRLGRITKRSWNGRPFLGDLQGFLKRLGY